TTAPLRDDPPRGMATAAAVPAEREGGAHDCRQRQPVELVERCDDRRNRNLEPARLDGFLELEPGLCALDRVEAGADQLDAELVEDALVRKLPRQIERRLSAHRRQ